jgi:hypothetical protein
MTSLTVEMAARALAELNQRFCARELLGEAFYVEMRARGFIHAQCVLVSIAPDGSNTYFGRIIRQDGRVFDFDVDLDDSAFSSWIDVTEKFERDLRARRFKPWSPELLAHAEFVRRRDNLEEDDARHRT